MLLRSQTQLTNCCQRQQTARAQSTAGFHVSAPLQTALPGSNRQQHRAFAQPLEWKTCCPSSRGKGSRQQPSRLVTTARRSGPSGEIDYADRAVASLPYLVPLFDGLKYGKFVFMQYPIFMRILGPLDPLVRLYFGFPFASLIVFFAIYSGIVTNQSFSRYVRFNGMQSILLDILLIFPSLLERVFPTPMGGPGLQIFIQAYNTIFLFVFICVAYGIGSCLLGRTPRLPLISDAANQQVR